MEIHGLQSIPLTKGKTTIIDDADFEWASQFRWCAVKGRGENYYAHRGIRVVGADGKFRKTSRQMQRDLLDPEIKLPRSVKADHVNGDTLDNRRENLRLSTDSGSNANRCGWTASSHGFKGVYYVPRPELNGKRGGGLTPYVVKIKLNGRQVYGSSQADPVSGAKEYNRLALLHFGEFAKLNIIPDGEAPNE